MRGFVIFLGLLLILGRRRGGGCAVCAGRPFDHIHVRQRSGRARIPDLADGALRRRRRGGLRPAADHHRSGDRRQEESAACHEVAIAGRGNVSAAQGCAQRPPRAKCRRRSLTHRLPPAPAPPAAEACRLARAGPAPQPPAAPRPRSSQGEAAGVRPAACRRSVSSKQAAPPPDPRLINRKRVQDLVTINDALKTFHARTGAYPKAEGLVGANERGAAWIPGLAPDFLAAAAARSAARGRPRSMSMCRTARTTSCSRRARRWWAAAMSRCLGSGSTRRAIRHRRSASFGFWTPPFAGA